MSYIENPHIPFRQAIAQHLHIIYPNIEILKSLFFVVF